MEETSVKRHEVLSIPGVIALALAAGFFITVFSHLGNVIYTPKQYPVEHHYLVSYTYIVGNSLGFGSATVTTCGSPSFRKIDTDATLQTIKESLKATGMVLLGVSQIEERPVEKCPSNK